MSDSEIREKPYNLTDRPRMSLHSSGLRPGGEAPRPFHDLGGGMVAIHGRAAFSATARTSGVCRAAN